jgi:hypothetical protein
MGQRNPAVVMYWLTALTAPTGKYDSDNLINIGTNRWSFRLGLPTTVRLSKTWQPGKSTTFEILPSVDLFTPNNSPPLSSRTDLVPSQVKQRPLYAIEAHFTHDINERLLVSLDSYTRLDGETLSDGVGQDNSHASSSLGGTIGMAPWKNSRLTFSAGKVVWRNSNSADGYQMMMQYQHYF